MKVVFLEEVEGSGSIGEVRNVADGFARNYLLPRKLAVPATEHNIRIAEARAHAEIKHQVKLDAEAQVLVEKLVGKSIELTVKAGPQGRLYGSITSRDIAEELEKLLRVEVEHRQVEMEEPIREVGTFEVPIRFTRNVRASVEVTVISEGGEAPAAEEEAPAAEAAEEARAPESEEAPPTEEKPAAEAEAEETTEAAEEAPAPESEEASPTEEKPAAEAETEETTEAAEE